MKQGPVVFESQGPSLSGVLAAELDIVRLVIDRLGQLGNVVIAWTRAKISPEGALARGILRAVAAGESPPRRRRVAQIKFG